MSHRKEQIIHTTGRNNCGGRCVIHAHIREGSILRLTTDSPHRESGIPLCACARGMHYHETYLNDRRILTPLLRTGPRGEGRFTPISWEEAVDRITEQWIRIRDSYGPACRYVTYATGVSAAFQPNQLARRLLSLDGGFLDYYNSYSSACIDRATELMYGTGFTGNSTEDWLNSKLIILWGHNPAETRFDSVTMHYLRQARRAGIPIVVVDPRMSDTVLQLDAEWIPLRPATDAALMDAMAWVIYTEGFYDRDFLDRCCIGFDEDHMPEGIPAGESCLSYLLGCSDGIAKTPEWAEKITGVPARTIRNLALRYAQAKPAAMIHGFGAQRHSYGEQVVRGGILLACMTGNVGVSGGWAGGSGYWQRHPLPHLPKLPNPCPFQIPTFRWTDAADHGRKMTALDGVIGGEQLPSDIKMIINLAGNCLINQHGDINRTAALLRDETKVEFILCSDLFMTSSAKFADILLPGLSFLECENITMPWMWGDFVGYNNKVVPPMGEGRFEYDWLAEVAERLGLGAAFTQGRTTRQWLEHIYENLRNQEPELPEFNQFRENGIHRYTHNPPVIAFQDSCEDPLQHPFPTASGKIELFSEQVYRRKFKDFFPAIPRYVPPMEGACDPLTLRYPLQLIGWHTKRRCHSIHDNNPAMEQIDPRQLWIHPEDAAPRGITTGALLEVKNDRGSTRVTALVTRRICPGVVALAQGGWYLPDADGADTNGSINVLTSWNDTPYAHGNAQHTNLVEVIPL